MDKKTNTKRYIYFDFLRIFAMIAVVLIHVAAENWYNTDAKSITWNIYNAFDSIARWGVPIFVMISGALFLRSNKPLKEILRKNVLRLLIIFFFWSLIYSIWELSVGHITSISDFLINFFKGPSHLWFLLMIIGLYLITPLLKKIIEDSKSLKYFLTLSFIFAFLIPTIINIINVISAPTANTIKYLNNCINISFVLGYSGYYVLGYYLSKTNISKKYRSIIYLLGILGTIATIALSSLASYYKNIPNGSFYENMSINVLFMSVAVFVFAKTHFNPKLNDNKMKKLVFFSRCSLGVYAVHVLVLSMLDYCLGFNTASFNPLLSIPAITISTLVISLLISIILNKIPFINKWLV